MKVTVLIPTRGNRPTMLNQAINYYNAQDYQNKSLIVMDDKPLNNQPDITWRYKTGIQRVFEQPTDLCIIMEDDDFYQPNYISDLVNDWNNNNQPTLIGYNKTIYYHLLLNKYIQLEHPNHSSMFTTAFTKDILNTTWPNNSYSFLDLHLWTNTQNKLAIDKQPLAIGIKGHNEGEFFGGKGHSDKFRYKIDDSNHSFLKKITNIYYPFYKNIIQTINN